MPATLVTVGPPAAAPAAAPQALANEPPPPPPPPPPGTLAAVPDPWLAATLGAGPLQPHPRGQPRCWDAADGSVGAALCPRASEAGDAAFEPVAAALALQQPFTALAAGDAAGGPRPVIVAPVDPAAVAAHVVSALTGVPSATFPLEAAGAPLAQLGVAPAARAFGPGRATPLFLLLVWFLQPGRSLFAHALAPTSGATLAATQTLLRPVAAAGTTYLRLAVLSARRWRAAPPLLTAGPAGPGGAA